MLTKHTQQSIAPSHAWSIQQGVDMLAPQPQQGITYAWSIQQGADMLTSHTQQSIAPSHTWSIQQGVDILTSHTQQRSGGEPTKIVANVITFAQI